MRLVVASANRGKLTELERLLADLPVQLVTMEELGLTGADETGETFEANALIKARAVVAETGLAALADDSGLEVDALGGAPGVHSARYAGGDHDDAANNAKLVRAVADVPDAERTARFVCAAALVVPDGREWVERGTMEGRIVDAPRGTGGFGYDPHFLLSGDTRTTAELAPADKDARSHRGAALRAVRPHIEALASG